MVALPQDSLNVPQNAKPTTNGEVRSAENGRVGSIYQEQIEPCHLIPSYKFLRRKLVNCFRQGIEDKQISNHSKGHAGEVRSAENGRVGSIYQEQIEPCHLSSSIYYGGQDIYIRSCSDQDSGLNDDSEGDQSGICLLLRVHLPIYVHIKVHKEDTNSSSICF
ncbi:hypothetical protein V6Z11_A08G231200 [Gossypium hirsutum]|uniref:Uncharacterized protein isoform X4 n=1 Tax=Gossypium hirsutum TaxID=3635 RepID=A0ABM2YKD1_GOSHI|nr:uncharacterized protein LOC107940106 isoform X4 [Gossypium hirsutum]